SSRLVLLRAVTLLLAGVLLVSIVPPVGAHPPFGHARVVALAGSVDPAVGRGQHSDERAHRREDDHELPRHPSSPTTARTLGSRTAVHPPRRRAAGPAVADKPGVSSNSFAALHAGARHATFSSPPCHVARRAGSAARPERSVAPGAEHARDRQGEA